MATIIGEIIADRANITVIVIVKSIFKLFTSLSFSLIVNEGKKKINTKATN